MHACLGEMGIASICTLSIIPSQARSVRREARTGYRDPVLKILLLAPLPLSSSPLLLESDSRECPRRFWIKLLGRPEMSSSSPQTVGLDI